jgi:group II intron reverse transcriptase/maturase
MGDTLRSPTVSTQLQEIAKQARQHPDRVFTTLAHLMDVDFLREAYRRLNKKGAPGLNKVTAADYGEHLEENLADLHQRLCSGRYRAPPIKRVWIEKENGQQRPLGIPEFEDKIVQRAVEMLLSAIYEEMFYDLSHGFRKGHSQHKALHELREQCRQLNINWVLIADITGLFDNIDHQKLLGFIRRRVNDGAILRLIGKWLNAGVMEEDRLEYPEKGTPQGGVISPLLSNIFLHYVLDEWMTKEVDPRMKGKCFIIRWADDFIIGFQLETDAERVKAVLPKRFNRYGLELHPDKTSLIRFGRPPMNAKGLQKSGTFDFLGFTFYWGRSLKGYPVIKKKTARKRLNRYLKQTWKWCKENRHDPIRDQYQTLCAKLRGYYQYFGVRSNYKAIEAAYEYTEKAWRYWLSRRSHKGTVLFETLREAFPLPTPRIVHRI